MENHILVNKVVEVLQQNPRLLDKIQNCFNGVMVKPERLHILDNMASYNQHEVNPELKFSEDELKIFNEFGSNDLVVLFTVSQLLWHKEIFA